MDSLSKKIQNLGIHDFRNAARFAQNLVVQYEPYQIDIRRATNTDSWGPTPKHLSKVLRNRYQVPMYLMTEYILKRLIDHIAVRPKNLYEKARKDYVNYGAEWRVVLKCLVVIEFLMLNVDEGDELNQIRSCLTAHKHILTKDVANFKIKFSNDGKMEVHERGIQKKNETILQYLDDPQFLKKDRNKNKKNSMKIRHQGALSASASYNADASNILAGQMTASNSHSSYLGDSVGYNNSNRASNTRDIDGFDYDNDDFDDDDEDFEDFTSNPSSGSGSSAATPVANTADIRRRATLEEKRRQRREILRERIKNTEQQRKSKQENQQRQSSTNTQAAQDIPDLLDLDFSAPAVVPASHNNNTTTTTTTTLNVEAQKNIINNNSNDYDDDDGFGDFQSDASPSPIVNSGANVNTNNSAALDDLLNFGSNAPSTSNNNNNNNNNSSTKTTNDPNKDLFSDLFNNSKSLI